jgi:putative transposase
MSTGVFSEITGYHNRRSMRLKGYDYSRPGAYFVTMCLHDHTQRMLGDVVDGKMVLNEFGKIVDYTWHDLPNHNKNIALDESIIMPNHLHGIIVFVGAGSEPAPTDSAIGHALPEIIRQLKTFSSRRINHIRKTPGSPVWQRNFYDHIIRDEKSFIVIRQYMQNNPAHRGIDSKNHLADEIETERGLL